MLKARRDNPEYRLQRSVRRYLIRCLPADVAWTAVDHAAKLSMTRGAERKAQGVKPGQADLRFVLPPHGRSAEIELKAPRGTLSDNQRAWCAELARAGGLYAVCRSLEDVELVLRTWGVAMRNKPFEVPA